MKKYDIRTLMDFADIPEDRVDACLADFKDCIRYFRHMKEEAVKGGYLDKIAGMGFEWTDDGEVNINGYILEVVARGKGPEL